MFRNYLTTALRNLRKNKAHSFINIGGLSVGMGVALLIGLWVWDEISFNKNHRNYEHITQVMQNQILNDEIRTQTTVPAPLGPALRSSFGSDFKYVVISTATTNHIISLGDKQFTRPGNFMEADAPELLTLNMIEGSREGLKDPSSILLSAGLAKAIFGGVSAVGRTLKLDDTIPVKVTGVYEDLPNNSTFNEVSFIAPWKLLVATSPRWKRTAAQWDNNAVQIFALMADGKDIGQVSSQIRDLRLKNVSQNLARFKPALFLNPMSRWHLYSEWKNGKNAGGQILFVWLFSIAGIFVLLLACINFMNLSTARAGNRAREIGIRKAVGSLRSQLIVQFFCESLMMAFCAFLLALGLAQLAIPAFNHMAGKDIAIPWLDPIFWVAGLGFCLITGIIAGSYPAFYLSSFRAVSVLKGKLYTGFGALISRKVLVVLQFTVSITLIIGTIIVFRQIKFARNRPVGYSREGLITMNMLTQDIHKHLSSFSDELIRSGTALSVAESSSPATDQRNEETGFVWQGKDPAVTENFATVGVSMDFGKTVGWKLVQGRDFSRDFPTDSMGFVINEAAMKFMGLRNPVGEKITWQDNNFHVIGVVRDMVMKSPFDPVLPTIFYMPPWWVKVLTIRLNPDMGAAEAMQKVEEVFKRFDTDEPFNFAFVEEQYNAKFRAEERISQLAGFFAAFAIFISCLGLFGMASFMAEQRTKELGIRKVLGASVVNLWALLCRDFVVMVLISVVIATPAAYYLMSNWLQHYQYRTEPAWWIFVAAGSGALLITLLTVSFQSVKAALMNPVKNLRSE
ncbi:MAG TPA: ABC transporter permease [Puia sp.]|nr:ABC transporter permease [Puia sp.]